MITEGMGSKPPTFCKMDTWEEVAKSLCSPNYISYVEESRQLDYLLSNLSFKKFKTSGLFPHAGLRVLSMKYFIAALVHTRTTGYFRVLVVPPILDKNASLLDRYLFHLDARFIGSYLFLSVDMYIT